MTWPRLMNERTARRYVGGLDPLRDFGVTPQFHRDQPYFDKLSIDRAIDAKAGLTPPPGGDDPETALQAWRESRGSA